MNLIDTHAHLFLEEFDEDRAQVVDRARQAGLTHIFMPNIDSTSLAPLLQMCDAYPGYCFPMIGLHPTSVNENFEAELDVVQRHLATNPRFVAIGEIGMDLYWDRTYEAQQRIVLNRQLRWALDICEVMEPYRETPLRGIFHCFTGTEDEARRILSFPGFLIGIGGVVTFKKSTLPEVLHHIPLERLVLETDAPYLAPVPHRGQRNESAYVKDTLLKVAEILQLPPEQVAEKTSLNALKLFNKVQSED